MNYEKLGALKSGVVGELDRAGVALSGIQLEQEAGRLRTTAANLNAGVFQVLVAGEFSRGKSTLINALLERDLLVTDMLASTAVITVLRYSTDERVEVIFKDGSEPKRMTFADFKKDYSLSEDDREILSAGQSTAILTEESKEKQKELQERLRFFEVVERADFYVNFPLLANGVNMVDSPGLAESPTRTMLTEEQARRAHAFIVVLSALQLLTTTESSFLLRLKASGLHRHLFIAVNYCGSVNPRDRERVRTELRRRLAPLFSNSSGEFEAERFQKRVFLMDLRPLVDAWYAGSTPRIDETTGLPALSRSLEDYLCGPEPMEAAFQVPLRQITDSALSAEASVEQRLHMLQQPVDELEEKIGGAETAQDVMRQKIERLEHQYETAGTTIANFVYNDLLSYVEGMKGRWGGEHGYMKTRLNLKELGLLSIGKAMWSKEQKKNLCSILEREGRLYLERSFQEWADALPEKLEFQEQLRLVEKLLGGETKDLLTQIAELKQSVSGVHLDKTQDEFEARRLEKIIQAISGLIVGPSLAAGALAGDGKWSGFLSKALTRLAVGLVLAMFTPAGWFAAVLVAMEAIFVGVFKSNLRDKFGVKLGDEIHAKLLPGVIEQREEFIAPVRAYFTGVASELAADLHRDLDQQMAIWKDLLEEKKQESDKLEEHRTHLDSALAEIRSAVAECRRLINEAQAARAAA